MFQRLVSLVSPARNRRPAPPDDAIQRLYASRPYLDAYAEHTDLRVAKDPHAAVGGLWEEIGQLQFRFLQRRGLSPHHSLLDIGCGTLRGGRLFIRYLDPGRYTGLDISPRAIDYARSLVEEEGLTDRKPRLLLNESRDLRFETLNDETFDFLLAQSVFTHLRPEHIEECLAHVGRLMHPDSRLFFTYHPGEHFRQKGLKDFRYPFSFFESLANRYGFELEEASADYPHPRKQAMAMLSNPGGKP